MKPADVVILSISENLQILSQYLKSFDLSTQQEIDRYTAIVDSLNRSREELENLVYSLEDTDVCHSS